ncbi:uncharacterized protein AMSG_12154 [Thecamonas trahens ATCC 50062]|uniref:Major facilitator superfamily (MFS) profile domain-containing protein n=1 Tax=Thecamonas trahens ATCC 50062 TaxID=461836 RepID=A0A0L0DJP4_THETB|nr:hypothetical protein AMSG_12154 [Thecamonas trahens ATCC 50062]KNC52331.1 hypothetical protein AMSG_12154 [Thecamonas trahens ATCC 50062]|eukprot:XP_013755494.1 hypothetical protein AMSG_12154 [Thecamonas trahens ATCC 50062]
MLAATAGMAYTSGLAAALSPCVVVLIPLVLFRFSGHIASKPLLPSHTKHGARPSLQLVADLAGFALGFLTAYVAFASAVAYALTSSAAGGVTAAMGMIFAVSGALSLADRMQPLDVPLLSWPPAVGVAFAALVSINPCTIPFLAVVISYSARSAAVALVAFGCGLLTPAITCALMGSGVVALVKRHGAALHYLNRAMSAVLIAAGGWLVSSVHTYSTLEAAIVAAAAPVVAAFVLSAFAADLPPNTGLYRDAKPLLVLLAGATVVVFCGLVAVASPPLGLASHNSMLHAALTVNDAAESSTSPGGGCIDLSLLPSCTPCAVIRIAALAATAVLTLLVYALHVVHRGTHDLVVAHTMAHTTKWYAMTAAVMLGTVLLSLLGSTPNAFNRFNDALKANGYSDSYVNLVASWGLVAVNLNFVMGALKDHIGGRKGFLITAALGTVLGAGGYMIMSLVTSTKAGPLLCFAFFLVGLGNGACFIVAMSVGVSLSPTGSGPSVALVGAAMGLSVAFTVNSVNVYGDAGGCAGDHCWASWMRLLALFCLANYPHLLSVEDRETESLVAKGDVGPPGVGGDDFASVPLDINSADAAPISAPSKPYVSPSYVHEPISFLEALVVLKHPYYLFLFAVEFIGFFSAIFILTQASQIWDDFAPHGSSELGGQILSVFSYFNVVAALAAGSANEILSRRRICRTATFAGITFVIWGALFIFGGILAATTGNAPSKAVQVIFFLVLTSDAVLFGAMLVLFPTILAEEYGYVAFAKIFGLLNLSPAAASFIAPQLTGAISKAAGSYNSLFFAIGALMALGGIGLIFFRNTKPLNYMASTRARLASLNAKA